MKSNPGMTCSRLCSGMILGLVLLLDACGGRVARPVPSTTPSDHLMTCVHIRAEHATNLEKAMDIGQEKSGQASQNVGHLLLTGGLFLNLNDSEKREIEALSARNNEGIL